MLAAMKMLLMIAAVAAFPAGAQAQFNNPWATPAAPTFSAHPFADPWRPQPPPPETMQRQEGVTFHGYPSVSPQMPEARPFNDDDDDR